MLSFKSSKSTSNLVEVSSCDFQPQVTALASIVSARPAKYLAQPTAQKQRPSGVGRCAKKLCYESDEFVATKYVQFSSTAAQCLVDCVCDRAAFGEGFA